MPDSPFVAIRNDGKAKGRPRAALLSRVGCSAAVGYSAAGSAAGSAAASAFVAASFSRSARMSWSRLIATLAQPVHHGAGAGRDQPADDDVLLEAVERVDLAVDRRLGEHARRLLERRRRDERAGLQRGLGDAEQHRMRGRRLLAFLRGRALTSSNSILSTCSPWIRSVSPESSISTFCSICRTITSMCLSLIVTPCSR